MPQLLFFLLFINFVWLLFKGGIYFFRKPNSINNSWIRYIQAIQWQLLEAVSITHSLSIPLSALERSFTTRTGLAPACWQSCIHVYVPHMLAPATIRLLFVAAFILLRAPDCAATIRGYTVQEKFKLDVTHDSSSIKIEIYNNGKTHRLLKLLFFIYNFWPSQECIRTGS